MCRPEFVADGRVDASRPELLRDEDLIHVTWRVGFSSYPDWGSWLAAQGAARTPRHELGHTADTSSLAIDLARAGCGIVLGQSILAESELSSGELVAPFRARIPLPYDYCAVYARAQERNPAVRAFVEWLAVRWDPVAAVEGG